MSKEDFFQKLDKESQEFVQFLLDVAYSNGFSAAIIQNALVQNE